ncbi:unnamed protein product [Trichogramma brassicae]|uniref:Uncharacterized protein n=1 Tax=Trichogramma brassicae TaxID=86971 RepID=A0A6H5IDV7_9HYME|nr:unnamed protein product [Trichogramma brassicae]
MSRDQQCLHWPRPLRTTRNELAHWAFFYFWTLRTRSRYRPAADIWKSDHEYTLPQGRRNLHTAQSDSISCAPPSSSDNSYSVSSTPSEPGSYSTGSRCARRERDAN